MRQENSAKLTTYLRKARGKDGTVPDLDSLTKKLERWRFLSDEDPLRASLLDANRRYCDFIKQHGSLPDHRRYNTLSLKYFSQKEMTAKQIAVCQSINLRTVYKDLSNAIEQFYYFL